MHKIQLHLTKLYKANSMKELFFFLNSSQKHNQLLKNNLPPIKNIDCVTNTFDHQVYTNKKLWPILKY